MDRKNSVLRSFGATVAITVPLLAASCASNEPWTFGLSREFYESTSTMSLTDEDLDPASACGAVIILALPLVIDLVILPVTLSHDIFVHGLPH